MFPQRCCIPTTMQRARTTAPQSHLDPSKRALPKSRTLNRFSRERSYHRTGRDPTMRAQLLARGSEKYFLHCFDKVNSE